MTLTVYLLLPAIDHACAGYLVPSENQGGDRP